MARGWEDLVLFLVFMVVLGFLCFFLSFGFFLGPRDSTRISWFCELLVKSLLGTISGDFLSLGPFFRKPFRDDFFNYFFSGVLKQI